MHNGNDIARSSEVIPDLEASTQKKNVGANNVLAANAVSRRPSAIILGEEIYADDGVDKRVKWAQRGTAVFAFLGVSCYIPGVLVNSSFLYTLTIVFGILANVCMGIWS